MKRFKLFPLMFATLLGPGLTACGEAQQDSQNAAPAAVKVVTAVVQIATLPRLYAAPGSVVSDETIHIASRVTGFIQQLPIREGDRIAAGALLAQIDPSDLEGAIQQTEAAVKAAETELEDAARDQARIVELAASGTVASETVRKAQVRRSFALARKAEAVAARDTARAQLRYTSITSPVDGVVVERHVEPGDLATPGKPLLVIVSDRAVLFETFIPESLVAHIHIGDPASVQIDALSTSREGAVVRVVPAGDPVTRRFLVKVAFAEQTGLLSGMFGRAQLRTGEDQSPVIPPMAMVERGGLRGVFEIDDANIARFRWLHTGRETRDWIEVQAGLNGGERIAVSGLDALRDSMPVAPEPGTAHE